MNEVGKFAYIEAEGEPQASPFQLTLPDLPPGVISQWLERRHPGEIWVLDPIGASPQAVLEMAAHGYKVLVAVNNPIAAFELNCLARAPKKEEYLAALRDLALQKKGGERLEEHMRGLYATRCASCGREVQAEYFLWRKGEEAPFSKNYQCPACGDEGEHATTEEDLKRLKIISRSDSLHRSRALERIPGGTLAARKNAEEITAFYSPRPLYALFTLINKLEGMKIESQERMLLDALLLSALDAGHSLRPAGDPAARPRALNTPAEFVERNLWLTMEKAINLWSQRAEPVRLTRWPELPAQPGICIFQGRMRDLLSANSDLLPETIVCVLPRPNQVFWSLATLWAAWLWGKESTANFKNVLERQRFDWYWHANALQSAIAPAVRMAKKNCNAFFLLPEPTGGFVTAAFEGCCASQLQLSGLAWKNEDSPLQSEWKTQPLTRESKKVNLQRIIREAVHACLNEKEEPARYQELHVAAAAALAVNEAFPASIQQLTYERFAEIQSEISKTFQDRKILRRMEATAQDLDSGTWWLAQSGSTQTTLADRVETELVKLLIKEENLRGDKVQGIMNSRFPGFLTPPAELIRHCLSSYADFHEKNNIWKLKENESPASRQKDMQETRDLMEKAAKRMGLELEGENPYTLKKDRTFYRLFASTQATLSGIFKFIGEEETCEMIFLFPGSRSALLRYKLDRDAWLRERTSKGWHFMKFRTLRDLALRADLSLDLWDLLMDSDPISLEEATQLSMFL